MERTFALTFAERDRIWDGNERSSEKSCPWGEVNMIQKNDISHCNNGSSWKVYWISYGTVSMDVNIYSIHAILYKPWNAN